jgi:STE24 endopeptidase
VNEPRASRYHRQQRWAAVLAVCAAGALLAGLAATPASVAIRALANGSVAVYTAVLAALYEIVTLPIAFYGGYVLERRYGMSRETVGRWSADRAKAAALGAVLAVAGAEIVYAAIRTSPRWWWALSALVFAAAAALLARVTPTLLLPLFFRFHPLGRESLRDRLVALSGRAGVPVLGVYEWGLGARTRRANAALVGAGTTRRILLSDTLLANYSDDEIEVILAHELGHHVHRDIQKGLIAEAALLLIAFYGASRALEASWTRLGLAGVADVAGLPVLLLAGGLVSLAATPLVNAFLRANERRADRYALALTNRPHSFVSAMKRLAAQNMAEERPSAATRLLFHSHPTIEERIQVAESYTAIANNQ